VRISLSFFLKLTVAGQGREQCQPPRRRGSHQYGIVDVSFFILIGVVLHLSIAENNKVIFDFLMSHPACNIDAADTQKRTGMHWAAVLGYDYFLKALLDAGAHFMIGDDTGATPLHYSVCANRSRFDAILKV
jgi:hypothetical protein